MGSSEAAENSALNGGRVGHFDPLSIFIRLSFTSERGKWKANAKTAAKSIHITAEQWHMAGKHGEDYRSFALLATLKQAERFNLKDPKGIFMLFTCRKDVGRVWNELEH